MCTMYIHTHRHFSETAYFDSGSSEMSKIIEISVSKNFTIAKPSLWESKRALIKLKIVKISRFCVKLRAFENQKLTKNYEHFKNYVNLEKIAHFWSFFAIFKCTQLWTEPTDFNDSHLKLKLCSFSFMNFELANHQWLLFVHFPHIKFP